MIWGCDTMQTYLILLHYALLRRPLGSLSVWQGHPKTSQCILFLLSKIIWPPFMCAVDHTSMVSTSMKPHTLCPPLYCAACDEACSIFSRRQGNRRSWINLSVQGQTVAVWLKEPPINSRGRTNPQVLWQTIRFVLILKKKKSEVPLLQIKRVYELPF